MSKKEQIKNGKQRAKGHAPYYQPLLQALRDKHGIASKQEAVSAVCKAMGEPEVKLTETKIAWACTYLRYEGYIKPVVESGRDSWALSEEGWSADLDSLDITGIYDRGVARGVKRAEKVKKPPHPIHSTPEQTLESPPEYNFHDELLAKLRRVSPRAFEIICCDLLRSLGFEDVLPTPQTSGEEGFDGVGFALNPLVKTKYLFEFKRYRKGNSVSRPVVQKLAGILANSRHGANHGIILATSNFSKPAQTYAKQHANIGLVGGDELAGLFEKSKVGLKEVSVIDDEFFARFDADSAQEPN